ncbi:hypothetical protein JUJ52_08890 [Virgibacillus sp. AGTR]|uniref:hypothetical protein n=1 Tax=Virgibacillus sp. AGTR TaxID=2812055 RepID=UPI001D165466|nr:hypothetical protein [Virgibacillus sp. AGTR]MCC2250082.1 hypothetical protein [Virgibacillus sp. AGTR]
MKEIGIQRAIEEVSIDGTVYEIDTSDDKRKKYAELASRLNKLGDEIETQAKQNDEKVLVEALEKVKEETKLITNEVIGEGAFEDIYPKTNNSTEHTIGVVSDVLQYIKIKQDERQKQHFEKKRSKYTKKKK